MSKAVLCTMSIAIDVYAYITIKWNVIMLSTFNNYVLNPFWNHFYIPPYLDAQRNHVKV